MDATTKQGYLDQLQGGNDKAQREAVVALAELKDPSLAPLFLEQLKHESFRNRWRAIDALAELQDPSLIPIFIDLLAENDPRDEEARVNHHALNALIQFGDAVIPHLLRTLNYRVLEDPSDHDSIWQPVWEQDQADENAWWHRYWIVSTLSGLNSYKALPALIWSAHDPNRSVSKTAAKGLGKLYTKPPSATKSDVTFLVDFLRTLQPIGDDLDRDDIAVLSGNAETVVVHLGRMSKRAFNPLVVMLHDDNPWLREQIVCALGEFGELRATPYLIGMLDDTVSSVRASAVDALRKLKSRDASSALRNALQDEDFKVRWQAVRALGQIDGKNAFLLIAQMLLDDPHDWVKEIAIYTLGIMNDPRAYDILVEQLSSSNNRFRDTACQALGNLGDKRALSLLREIADNEDEYDGINDVNVGLTARLSIEQLEGR